MTNLPVCDRMVSEAIRHNENPEGIDIPVPVSDPEMAKHIALHAARGLYRDRDIGGVLHIERHLSGWVVTVQDRGPRRPR